MEALRSRSTKNCSSSAPASAATALLSTPSRSFVSEISGHSC